MASCADHSVPEGRVVAATVLKFGGFLASGIYRSLAFAVPPVVIGSMMSIRALTFPKGFVRASVMASIGMALVRTLLGTEGRGPLLCRPLRPDSYSRIVVLSQVGFVVPGGVCFRFPLAFWFICQGRGCSLYVRAVPSFAGRVASTFGPPSGWRNWSWLYAIG